MSCGHLVLVYSPDCLSGESAKVGRYGLSIIDNIRTLLQDEKVSFPKLDVEQLVQQ